MPSPPAYDAFLSYNSLDHAIVGQVTKELENRKCTCFVDRKYLQPGRDWVEALERALSGSRSVAMFIGPHEMGRWQQRERAWALDQLADRSDFPVIPVLLPGCEPPLGFMKQLMWIDLRNDPTDSGQLDALAAAIKGETINHDGKPEPRAMICPYRGLLAFREEDADFFFGRQKYTDDLVKLVEQESIVAVTGASGSGKSSVVRAGLVPRLRKRGEGPVWDILTMFPRENPLHSLADVFLPLVEPELSGIDLIRKRKALADDLEQARIPLWDLVAEGLRQQKGTERLLLVVDQWEELYTTCKNDTQRNRFIHELLDATSRVGSQLSVVFTVRWDFYGEILQNRPLLDRLEHSRLDLGPMNRDELRSAIEGPGAKVGITFQDGLVDRILDDAGGEPGSLPLLEFVLEELWKCRRGDGQLTHDAYGKLGRLTGAIANRAETLYSKLSREEQTAAESLFRRLVQAGAKTEEDTRRRADLNSLDATSQQLARKLADERLLVTTRAIAVTSVAASRTADGIDASAGETVEVAHEELLRRWERLKKWVDTDRQFLQWRSRLIPRLEEYKRDSKSALLTGNALRESRMYVPSKAAELDENERTFVVASQAASRRRKMVAGISAVSVLCVAVFVGYRVRQSNRQQEAHNLVESLLNPAAGSVQPYLKQLEEYRDLAATECRTEFYNTDRDEIQRVHAAYGLIRFGNAEADVFTFLLDSVTSLPKEEAPNLLTALSVMKEKNAKQLENELQRCLKPGNGDGESRGKYLTIAASFGMTDIVAAGCAPQTDPSERTSFIHGFRDFSGDVGQIGKLLDDEKLDPATRAALCVIVGRFGEAGTDGISDVLKKIYINAPDAGTHSCARWALLQKGLTEREIEGLMVDPPKSDSAGDWYVIPVQGITMVKIPGGSFALGDVTDVEDPTEKDEPKPFDAFWLSDREVSVGQFEAMMPQLKLKHDANEIVDPTELLKPATLMTWFDAIAFCNRLSKTENLPPYYNMDEDNATKDYEGHITAAQVSIIDEKGHGYRLPTEAEWENACRAMSATDYCYGDSDTLLTEYVVFLSGSTEICGQKIPNRWGLFDMHGNVDEWCWDKPSGDSDSRVLRGGSFNDYPQYLRSAYRYSNSPVSRGDFVGFRISRTP